MLHRDDDGNERPLERFIDARQTLGSEPGLQRHPKSQRHVGVLGGVFGRLVERHRGEGLLRLPSARRLADRLSKCHARMAQMALGERVHPVGVATAVKCVGEQHRVVERSDLDAVALHHEHVVLDVLADLQDRGILEQRTQQGQRFRGSKLRGAVGRAAEQIASGSRMTERDVAGFSWSTGE